MTLSSNEVSSIGHGVAAAIEFYAAYWAFEIRHALASRLYRNQALGIALVAVSFAILDLEQVLLSVLKNSFALVIGFLPTLLLVFLVLFYWIDASLVSSRRSDPLLRDSLHWRSVRIILWIFIGIESTLVIVFFVFFQISQSNVSHAPIALLVAFLIPIFSTPLAGALSLPISAMRSRDTQLRKHLKWFGLFAIFLLLVVPLTASSYVILNTIAFPFIFAADYSLYKSARSLAPLNKLYS